MKKIKLGVLAFVLGETIALFYKDKDFKDNFKKVQGLEKIKVWWKGLIGLNKSFIDDIKSYEYNEKYETIKEKIVLEKDKLEAKVDEIKAKLADYNNEKIQPILKDLESKYVEIKDKTQEIVIDIKEKVKLEDNIEKIKTKINEIKEKFNK